VRGGGEGRSGAVAAFVPYWIVESIRREVPW
jgi:hypothetical protein